MKFFKGCTCYNAQFEDNDSGIIFSYSQGINNKTYEYEPGGTAGTSYGWNSLALDVKGKRRQILALDYWGVSARTTDSWDDHDANQDGVPDFARHSNCMNVLFNDGSVLPRHPCVIQPVTQPVREEYWEPEK